MIHRICNDGSYLLYSMSTSDVLKKLGGNNPFHIKRAPVPYADVWKEPLCLDFGPGEETTKDVVPDLSANNGRMFFNEKAYGILSDHLKQDGEFLPVTYLGGSGYIFNPLVVADEHDAIDETVTMYDEYGDLDSLGFLEGKLPAGTLAFRSKVDVYYEVFCTDRLKQLVEDAGLVGITFHPDLSDLAGGASVAH